MEHFCAEVSTVKFICAALRAIHMYCAALRAIVMYCAVLSPINLYCANISIILRINKYHMSLVRIINYRRSLLRNMLCLCLLWHEYMCKGSIREHHKTNLRSIRSDRDLLRIIMRNRISLCRLKGQRIFLRSLNCNINLYIST